MPAGLIPLRKIELVILLFVFLLVLCLFTLHSMLKVSFCGHRLASIHRVLPIVRSQ